MKKGGFSPAAMSWSKKAEVLQKMQHAIETQELMYQMSNRKLDEAIDVFQRHLGMPVMVCVSTNGVYLKHRVREVSTFEYCTLYDAEGHFYLEKLLDKDARCGIADLPVGGAVEIKVEDKIVFAIKRRIKINDDTYEFVAACLSRRSVVHPCVYTWPLRDCVDALQQAFLGVYSKTAV